MGIFIVSPEKSVFVHFGWKKIFDFFVNLGGVDIAHLILLEYSVFNSKGIFP